jgi:transcriptional regulator with XRE-family HTH domain
MSTALAQQLSTRMKAKNLSASTLEREAGLKTHAVLNILRGKSKKPSAEALQAIATILGCTVADLLSNQDIFFEEEEGRPKSDLLTTFYDHPILLEDTIKLVNKKILQNEFHLTVQQVLTCVEEIYIHSLQKNLSKADQDFADWFMDLMEQP